MTAAASDHKLLIQIGHELLATHNRLAVALDRKGMNLEARAEFERFLTVWKDADPDIPELVDARHHL